MDDLNGTLQELLETLDSNEVAYVFARSEEKTDKDSYEEAGLTKGWWFGKDKERRNYMNAIALKLKIDTAFKAKRKLVEAAEHAAEKLVALIDDRHSSVAQRSAIEVLDRTVGKAVQKTETEVSGKDGGKIIVKLVDND